MLLAESAASSVGAGIAGIIVTLIMLAILVAIPVGIYRWLVIGPVQQMNAYILMLKQRFPNPADGALFQQMYLTKQPKNAVTAWLLTFFLSPTISYLYQNKFGLAAIAFLTLQGVGVWWVITWFTMPGEVIRHNRNLADQAFNELMIARPGMPHPGSYPQLQQPYQQIPPPMA